MTLGTKVPTSSYTPNSHLASVHCDLRTWQLETLGKGQRWDSEAAAPQWTTRCLVFSILPSPGVPSEKTQRLKLTTPDASAPCLSLHCLGEGSSVDTQAAYTDQMGHVTSPRVNDGLPERLAALSEPFHGHRWLAFPQTLVSCPGGSDHFSSLHTLRRVYLCRRKCKSVSWVLLLQ